MSVYFVALTKNISSISSKDKKEKKSSPAGFEPATSGLEVQRAIHCATGTAE